MGRRISRYLGEDLEAEAMVTDLLVAAQPVPQPVEQILDLGIAEVEVHLLISLTFLFHFSGFDIG